MPGKPSKQPKPVSNARPAPPPEKAPDDPALVRAIHGKTLPGVIYGLALTPMLGEKGEPDASAYASDVIARMAPRDAVEEMLIAQLLFAHARVMRLTELANRQTGLESLRTVHEYADRASNTYRRLMLALAEYRRPPRAGDTFAVVKQTNIAGQQVIQNHENSTKNATNEQGFNPAPTDPGDARSTHASPAALPADCGGIGFPAFIRPAREAVDAVHRAPNSRRQGSIADERDQTR